MLRKYTKLASHVISTKYLHTFGKLLNIVKLYVCAENKSSLFHLGFDGKFYFIDCPLDGRSMLGKQF